ncbi:kinase-like domain-containing protein [Flammula alnicola]|nr:kinase-like domain-containing protein [Flammula alnicola]
MLLPYWDRSGDVHQLEPPPQSYHDWAQGEEVPADHQGLHTAVKDILDQALIRTSCRAIYMNITLDATLDDGKSVILRQRHNHVSNPILEKWSLVRFQNEIKLLRWLRDSSSIPVPNILAIGSNYTIQEKMPGSTLTYHWHSLSEAAKGHFISAYVDILSELFHLPVPQHIGSASFDEGNGMSVGPLLAANPSYSIPKVIDDISDYFYFLFTVKRQTVETMKPEDKQRAEATLSYVETKTQSILRTISDPSCLRCVLTHADPHGYNILVNDDGDITAVLDWEINYIQPAILGVDYPLWLSTQGRLDPRFASDSQWWEESPAERERLCTLFEEKVQERDPELYKCLIEGRDLRAVVGWLMDTLPDPGFDRMGAWGQEKIGVP